MSRFRYPAIPLSPDTSPSQAAAIECIEIVLRRRGEVADSMVSVKDLIDLGLIKAEDLAKIEKAR